MLKSLEIEKQIQEDMKKSLPPVKGGDASFHMLLRQHAMTIKNFVVADKIKKDPVNAVVENSARDGMDTSRHLQSVINPTVLPSPVEASAKAEIEKYVNTNNLPRIDATRFGALDPLFENTDFENSDSTRAARESQRDIQQKTYLGNEVYKNDGGFSNGTSDEGQQRLFDKFGINGEFANSDIGKMAKACIPCGARKLSLNDIQFSNPLAGTMDALNAKLKNLENLLNSLKLGNQAELDLCDLIKLLDAQCVPDLVGLLSLLGIMQLKYFSSMDLNMRSALNAIIGPFLAPVIGPLVHNLERYVDMIIDPLICVVESMETQMYKLNIVDAKAKMDSYKKSYNKKQIDFYESKIQSLNRRSEAINTLMEDGNVDLDVSFKEGDKLNAEGFKAIEATTKFLPKYPISTTATPNLPDPTNVKGIAEEQSFIDKTLSTIKSYANPRDAKTEQISPKLLGTVRRDLGEEQLSIVREISITQQKIQKLKLENNRLQDYSKDSYENTKKSRAFKDSIKSSIFHMTYNLNQGIESIRQTLNVYRLELERTITGRIQTQEDLIELTRSIQQIQSWISIVNALLKLKQQSGPLRDICNHGNSSDAMGAFVGEFKNQPSGGQYDFYKATDENGDELMVIAPGGSKLNVTSIDFEELGFGVGDATLNDVQNVATFNDLGEADKLNRKGMLLDIGNISGSDISISLNDAGANKTDLDLKAENSYVIIKNDFCSKAPFKTGSSDTIRKWAENLL